MLDYRLWLKYANNMLTSTMYDIPDPKLLEEINECFNREP